MVCCNFLHHMQTYFRWNIIYGNFQTMLETKASPSVRDRQLLVRTSNFLHISLQIDVWIYQNFDQDRQLFQLSPEHCFQIHQSNDFSRYEDLVYFFFIFHGHMVCGGSLQNGFCFAWHSVQQFSKCWQTNVNLAGPYCTVCCYDIKFSRNFARHSGQFRRNFYWTGLIFMVTVFSLAAILNTVATLMHPVQMNGCQQKMPLFPIWQKTAFKYVY